MSSAADPARRWRQRRHRDPGRRRFGTSRDRQGRARAAALVSLVIGGGYAAVSLYWGLGGSWLLDTVGGSLEPDGRAGSAALQAVVLGSALLKLAAAVAPSVLVARRTGERWRRPVRLVCVLTAVVLVGYGAVLSVAGWAVQAGLLKAGRSADHRALAWHAFLWDPWFLAWGLAVAAALIFSRGPRQ